MLKQSNYFFSQKILTFRKYFVKIIFVVGTASVLGCGRTVWKNHGDSCIRISETPPLRRVINYSDHDLCRRKLSPRTAPNPQTRPQTVQD